MFPELMIYAVRLPAILTPDSLDSYVVVGIRCPRCEVAYSLAIPRSRAKHEDLLQATRWAEENIGDCGAHPAVLYEPESQRKSA